MKLTTSCAVLLIVAQACLAPQSAADENARIELPDMGDTTGTLLSPQQEKEVGAAFFRNLHGQLEINQDPEVSDYIQSLGDRLTGASEAPNQAFTFFVVNQPVINAFAGPGGYIGVNSGLILLTEEESELASVMAHEVAHVTQRHIYQSIEAQQRAILPMLLATVAGALLTGGRGAMLGQAAYAQYMINFTRDNEAEADRVGMQTLARSSFDPRAMPAFFEKMQQSTRFANSKLPEFLLTHPVTVSRISDTRGRAENFPYRQYPDSMAYQIIKARLRVETNPNPRAAIEYFLVTGDQGTPVQRDVKSYGLALAYLKSRRYDEARKILQKLVTTYPNQSHFVRALAEVEFAAHDFAKAIALQESALERFPGNRALSLDYAETLLQSRRPQDARKVLNDYLRHHPPTAEVYEFMARAYDLMGNPGEAHRYMGEAYYAAGQIRSALQQLQMAKKAAGDNYYLNAVIDERSSSWRAEERARVEEP